MPDVSSNAPADVRLWVALDVHRFSIIAAMAERLELLQRPFVVVDGRAALARPRAALARPVERVLELPILAEDASA